MFTCMCLISRWKLSDQIDKQSKKEKKRKKKERRFDNVNRSEGCILSCSNLSISQTVPSFLFSENALTIQGNAIWASNSSQSLHKADGCNRAVSLASTGSHIHVHGRLVNQESTSSPACASKRNITKPASQLGPDSKLAKVSTDTNSGNRLFEGSLTKGTCIHQKRGFRIFHKKLHCSKD